jgi:hypothetical protein
MSKWTNGSRWNSDVNNISGFLFSCASNMCADKAIAAHNADIDALTAERDELQRRLDDILGECCGARDVCARTIVAIAEGREG